MSNEEVNAVVETVPKDMRQLRSCLVCSLVKTADQFENDGCDNCENFLHLKRNRENVMDCTSSKFEGMVASCKPRDSWVCKWQRIKDFVPGIYAISVEGRLPTHMIRDLRSVGIVYRSRDTSKR
jgi:transcription elongation factor SPT4